MKVPFGVAIVLLVLFASVVRAVLVYDGTAANLSAPSDDPGWDAVGTIGGPPGPATAIFLGNNGGYGWFLTANHVNLANATLSIGGGNYTTFAGVDQIGTVDLKVFRIDTTIAGISPVSLSSSVPNTNAGVTMIGNGKTGTKVTWDIPDGNATWTSPGIDAEGYTWSGDNVKRWGTNTIFGKNISSASGNLLATDFDDSAGEAQGSLGDSGGGVFAKNGLNWELAGLIVAVGKVEGGVLSGSNFVGQPDSTSVDSILGAPNDKSVTFAVQIANYRNDILAAIPEPATIAAVSMGLCVLLGCRRRISGCRI